MGFIDWILGKSKEKREKEEKINVIINALPKIIDGLAENTSNIEKLLSERTMPSRPMNRPISADELFDILNAVEKPIRSAILSNDTLSVITGSGETMIMYGATQDLYNQVLAAESEQRIRELMFPEAIKTEKKAAIQKEKEKVEKEKHLEITSEQKKDIDENLQYLVDSGEFEVIDNEAYVKGINIPMPKLMTYKFAELVKKIFAFDNPPDEQILRDLEDEYQALRNFWMWCVNCPNAQSRNDLFKFLKNHDMRINKNGHFFAYRRVNTVDGKEQSVNNVTEISSEWLRIKKAKKGPKNYRLIKTDTETKAFKLDSILQDGWKILGNLSDLYEGLAEDEGQTFTDARTGTFDIRIGKEVSMDRSECDSNPSRDCSNGLHIGNKQFGFGGFGNTHILVLVNPMNAVSVPTYDYNKMRVCAYYPVAVINKAEEQTKFLEDADVLNLGNEYFAEQMEKLEEMANSVQYDSPSKKNEIAEASLEVLEEKKVDIKAILAKRKVKA